MSFRLLLTLATIICLTTLASAKPRSTQADTALAECKWAAEVQIKSVSPALGKGGAPSIGVRLTQHASRVFFGQKPGAELSVHPLDASHSATMADLKALVGTGESLLMVVNNNDQIVMVGKKQKQEYLLRTWYDFNGWWIYAADKTFGKESKKGFLSTLVVSAAEINSLMKKRKTIRKSAKSR